MVATACPMCCGEMFGSREDLKRHLDTISHIARCPYCDFMPGTLGELEHHIMTDECANDVQEEGNEDIEKEQELRADLADVSHETRQVASLHPEESTEKTKMDRSLLVGESLDIKEELDNQQFKLLEGTEMLDDDNHILIVGSDSKGLLGNQGIITTQNEDGTISLTSIEPDLPDDDENLMQSRDSDDDEVGDEMYSCNTCGVSFTSVLEHIQKYHSDQDVVIEVAEANSERLSSEMSALSGETKIEAKRMITDNGDIIETHYPVIDGIKVKDELQESPAKKRMMEEQCVDQSGRVYTRKFVQIDKFWSDENAEKFACQQCSQTYTNTKSLCAHMRVHKHQSKSPASEPISKNGTDGFGLFKCEECDTIFPSNKSLRLHKRMHDPIKARPMEGPVSYKPPAAGDGGELHWYHCDICQKHIHVGYRSIHDNYHRNTMQYHCEVCNRKFFSEDCLVMHMNAHNVEKIPSSKSDKVLPYTCLYCPRQFARPHEKVKHERIHTGEKPHSCEICGKSFRVSYCLTLHMRTHTGVRPYECKHCGKRFKAHSVYNHHLMTHSDIRAYKCPYCPKAFKTSVQLAGHKNSHTKPFSCKHCNRPFASLYAVRVHTETHRRQNNLKFSCELCGASYARNFALKDHMKSVHNQVMDSPQGLQLGIESEDATSTIMPKQESSLEIQLDMEIPQIGQEIIGIA